jgi:hypothetical protein
MESTIRHFRLFVVGGPKLDACQVKFRDVWFLYLQEYLRSII